MSDFPSVDFNDRELAGAASATGYLGYHDPDSMHIELTAFQPGGDGTPMPTPNTLCYVLTGDQMQDLYDRGLRDGRSW